MSKKDKKDLERALKLTALQRRYLREYGHTAPSLKNIFCVRDANHKIIARNFGAKGPAKSFRNSLNERAFVSRGDAHDRGASENLKGL